ncbi:AEC family transporter [Mucisphaera calidilacus]|uniref:Uncharacterized protein n=1 Tax=Mucisphaera calidilacus TaxID=2527982 RepID=A0A518BVD8_9BACT|nr:hypothetical protein [Mucisphaera calidilacus]QDU70904.1 hypothetical protein Pan265_07460 [Mucisphaera calidilacus]
MDARTADFMLFAVFGVLCVFGGYWARERGWAREELSRSLHFITISVIWSLIALIAIWRLPLHPSGIWILAFEPILVLLPALVITLFCRWLGFSPDKSVLIGIAAGLSNRGFTLGAYLCYVILANPDFAPEGIDASAPDAAELTAEAAFAYATSGVNLMAACGIVFLFPLARRFGPEGSADEKLGPLIFKSLVSLRAAMFYFAMLGAALAILQVPYPAFLAEGTILKILIYAGTFGAYAGIGLRLHFNRNVLQPGPHVILAAAQFVLVPLLTLALLATTHLTNNPSTPLLSRVYMVEALMPTAIQTVMIANLFHLDSRLASGLLVVNTSLFLLVCLPILLLIFAG